MNSLRLWLSSLTLILFFGAINASQDMQAFGNESAAERISKDLKNLELRRTIFPDLDSSTDPRYLSLEKKMKELTLTECMAIQNLNKSASQHMSSYSTQGNSHKANEDRFILEQVQGGTLAIVFDGHGGSEVSECLKNNFESCLMQQLQSNKAQNFSEAIDKSIFEIDKAIGQILSSDYKGSTATGIYIKNNRLHFFNIGDSRSIMINNDGSIQFSTQDHNPDADSDEYKRIIDAGGLVWKNGGTFRVAGQLKVSRAFGDYGIDYDASKENFAAMQNGSVSQRERNYDKKFVISTPDFHEMNIGDNNQFLVSASDGLWDVMRNEEVGILLCSQDNEHKTPAELAKILADEAIKRGSRDHITVLVLDLKKMNGGIRLYKLIGVPLGVILFSAGIYFLCLRLYK